MKRLILVLLPIVCLVTLMASINPPAQAMSQRWKAAHQQMLDK